MRLNEHQRAAVEASGSAVRIDAGAGTGKSTTLIARALWLADRHDQVRLTTFSRRGVRVLRERLANAMIPDHLRERIHVDTHHGLAAQLLRESGERIGWAPDWTIISRADQEVVEREAKDQLDLFDVRLRRSGLRTYDELLPAAAKLLMEHDDVAEEASQGTAHLVDEAHDSNDVEWRIDFLLSTDSLTVVGDPAQRIYGWRGALPMERVGEGLNWQRFVLPDNYRSGQAILDVANRLPIAGRVDLQARRKGGPGRVGRWAFPTDDELIDRLLKDDELQFAPERWAILARVNRRLAHVAERLQVAGIPVRAPGLASATWETPEARAVVDLLHVVANPHDSLHLARVLERAGWSRGQLLDAEFRRSNPADPCSLWTVASQPDQPIPEVIRAIDYCRTVEFPAQESIDELRVSARLPFGCPAIPLDWTPREFLDWLADPDRDEPEGAPGCYLGSIHSAKGEEYPNVLVLGMEEGSLPMARWANESRPEEERIAEERRALYVAITRAKERLILARRTERWVRGRGLQPTETSRFMSEIGGVQ